jgi:hypothetical protein
MKGLKMPRDDGLLYTLVILFWKRRLLVLVFGLLMFLGTVIAIQRALA